MYQLERIFGGPSYERDRKGLNPCNTEKIRIAFEICLTRMMDEEKSLNAFDDLIEKAIKPGVRHAGILPFHSMWATYVYRISAIMYLLVKDMNSLKNWMMLDDNMELAPVCLEVLSTSPFTRVEKVQDNEGKEHTIHYFKFRDVLRQSIGLSFRSFNGPRTGGYLKNRPHPLISHLK